MPDKGKKKVYSYFGGGVGWELHEDLVIGEEWREWSHPWWLSRSSDDIVQIPNEINYLNNIQLI